MDTNQAMPSDSAFPAAKRFIIQHEDAQFVAEMINALASTNWLGDAQKYPEMQTILDGLKTEAAQLPEQTAITSRKFGGASVIASVSGLDPEFLKKAGISPKSYRTLSAHMNVAMRGQLSEGAKAGLEAASHYARISAGLNALSRAIMARGFAQAKVNHERNSWQPETPASSAEIKEMRESIEREPSIEHLADVKAKIVPELPPSSDPETNPAGEWFKKWKTNPPKAWEDHKGLDDALKDSTTPIEHKLEALMELVEYVRGMVAMGSLPFVLSKAATQRA